METQKFREVISFTSVGFHLKNDNFTKYFEGDEPLYFFPFLTGLKYKNSFLDYKTSLLHDTFYKICIVSLTIA